MKNCDKLTKERKVQPLLSTDEPLCEIGKLACGDSICIDKGLFCDGNKDCNDGSDENACGKFLLGKHTFQSDLSRPRHRKRSQPRATL